MKVSKEDKEILYESYVFLFNLNKKSPHFFTDMRLNAIFTAFICSRKWAWNVIGISKNAYLALQESNFKTRPKTPRISRGHLVPRIDTFRRLFDRVENPQRDLPFSIDEFWSIFLPNDQTVLMTSYENGKGHIPDYYLIDNDKYQLFTNDGIGFCYKNKEKDFLRHLDTSQIEIVSASSPQRNPVVELVSMPDLFDILQKRILEINKNIYVNQLPSGYFSFKYPRKNHEDVSITDVTVQKKRLKIQILTSGKYEDPKGLISQRAHPRWTLGMQFEAKSLNNIQDAVRLIEQSFALLRSKYPDLAHE